MAIATPKGTGALGIIRASGDNCIDKLALCFSRAAVLRHAKSHTLIVGKIVFKNVTLDEVVVAIFRAPKSFTGEEAFEIYTHGTPVVMSRVLEALLEIGFREALRGEFSFRAYANGKLDLTRAEAIGELYRAKTPLMMAKSLERLSGALLTKVESVREAVQTAWASIQVQVEYPESEIASKELEPLDTVPLEAACVQLESLLASYNREILHTASVRVVLCGRVNAGKSSLFNVLVNCERAIVSSIEGTTRDYIESTINIGGFEVELFDTAGLRSTQNPIEQIGIERTRNLIETASVILHIIDCKTGVQAEDKEAFSQYALHEATPVILVENKIDLLSDAHSTPESSFPPLAADCIVQVSATTHFGIDNLCKKIVAILEKTTSEESQDVSLGNERQKAQVQLALDSLNHALTAYQSGIGLDAVCMDLESTLHSLDSLIGKNSDIDILDKVFSTFCVGK